MRNPPKLPSLIPTHHDVNGGSRQSQAPTLPPIDTTFSDDANVANPVALFDALQTPQTSRRQSAKGNVHHRTVRHILSQAAAEERAKKKS